MHQCSFTRGKLCMQEKHMSTITSCMIKDPRANMHGRDTGCGVLCSVHCLNRIHCHGYKYNCEAPQGDYKTP